VTLKNWPSVVFEALLAMSFGALLAVVLTAFVSAQWTTLYAQYPLKGHEKAAAAGHVSHDFYNSTRAMLHAQIAFVIGGILVGLFSRLSCVSSALLSWCFLWFGLLVIFNRSPAASESNLAFLAVAIFPVYTAPFLLAALVTCAIRRKLNSRAAVATP
jgi:hypothetical protein